MNKSGYEDINMNINKVAFYQNIQMNKNLSNNIKRNLLIV